MSRSDGASHSTRHHPNHPTRPAQQANHHHRARCQPKTVCFPLVARMCALNVILSTIAATSRGSGNTDPRRSRCTPGVTHRALELVLAAGARRRRNAAQMRSWRRIRVHRVRPEMARRRSVRLTRRRQESGRALHRAAAKEFGSRGISVNNVGPRPMDTPFFYGQETPERVEFHKSQVLAGSPGSTTSRRWWCSLPTRAAGSPARQSSPTAATPRVTTPR
jgi:hypothetical protein